MFEKKQHLENDRQLFLKADSLVDEATFEAFILLLKEERSFVSSVRSRVLEFASFLNQEQPNFAVRKLQEKIGQLLTALQELKAFTASHFLIFPRNQTGPDIRHCLYPDYFILEINQGTIEDHEFHLKAEKNLHHFADQAEKAYRSFRKAVRSKLKV